LELGRLGAFFLVSTRLANQLLPDGRNAHLTVQPAEWWHDQMRDAGHHIMRQETHSTQVIFWCRK
jgi:hypothetical protein